ncbi:class I SAM-dependent methyltransferase [Sphingomonas cavernae]|uniref:Class I SAM-dependent methyltransferase n=1 Tax=Sphingomonas cavernae TaxID=2320861 RepID=A0A418WLH8_9SPHN|nr:class I SAM-dependent methyltransferase [Sphingomonas cavernae]RJF90904.1 class I SAM-dependent methyltransferase [Sphingomonas cavernae]
MDGIYRYQRHIYDLTRKYYLLGRDRLIARLNVPVGGSVLEIGCGTGRNLIAVARAWPHAQCFGLDISPAMLETATATVARAGFAGRLALAQGDATAFVPTALFGRAAFDRVFLSYTLSMIPGWQRAIGAACDALTESGTLHIVDFGQQERLPRTFRILLRAWLSRFDVKPRADLPKVLADVADARGMVLEFTPLWRGYAWEAVLRKPRRAV